MLEILKAFFQGEGFKFEADEENNVLTFFVSGRDGNWMSLARADGENGQFVFYSVIPNRVPPEARGQVMEFITRANYNLLMGNFEMDVEDGEVRFKTGIDISGDRLTAELVKNVVYFNLIAMDNYLENLMKVMFGGMPARKAYEEAAGKLKKEKS